MGIIKSSVKLVIPEHFSYFPQWKTSQCALVYHLQQDAKSSFLLAFSAVHPPREGMFRAESRTFFCIFETVALSRKSFFVCGLSQLVSSLKRTLCFCSGCWHGYHQAWVWDITSLLLPELAG